MKNKKANKKGLNTVNGKKKDNNKKKPIISDEEDEESEIELKKTKTQTAKKSEKQKEEKKNTKKGVQLQDDKKSKKKSTKDEVKGKNDKNIKKDKDEDEDEESDKDDNVNIVKIIEKGGASVDNYVPNSIDYCVLPDTYNEFNSKHFTATLNLSDLVNNNNKFYMIQALYNSKKNEYLLWNRWGRVGYAGQNSNENCRSSEEAKKRFLKKFNEKTGKGYEHIEIDYSKDQEKEKEVKEKSKKNNKKDNKNENEKKNLVFENSVKNLLNLIYDINIMNQQMKEIGYDASKMPLGKLSQQMITDGYNILCEIEQVLKRNSYKDLVELSSRFYTIIPHNFGYQKMANFAIDSIKKLKEKLEMIESLSEIEIATKILKECENEDEIDILNNHYKKLNCEIKSLNKESEIFDHIKTYLKNSTSDNKYMRVEIDEAYELLRYGEDKKFKEEFGNKKLLWHGSRITNFVGILSQGLRIAPPEAPCSGYLFGKGVYFADMASKSVGYCCPTKNTALILLCEVACGNMNELYNTDYNAANLPQGKHCTKGMGVTHPNFNSSVHIENIEIPLGEPTKDKNNKGYLGYNEYIVYNTDQVKLRYLLRLNVK